MAASVSESGNTAIASDVSKSTNGAAHTTKTASPAGPQETIGRRPASSDIKAEALPNPPRNQAALELIEGVKARKILVILSEQEQKLLVIDKNVKILDVSSFDDLSKNELRNLSKTQDLELDKLFEFFARNHAQIKRKNYRAELIRENKGEYFNQLIEKWSDNTLIKSAIEKLIELPHKANASEQDIGDRKILLASLAFRQTGTETLIEKMKAKSIIHSVPDESLGAVNSQESKERKIDDTGAASTGVGPVAASNNKDSSAANLTAAKRSANAAAMAHLHDKGGAGF